MERRKQILYFVPKPRTSNAINKGQGFTGTGGTCRRSLKSFLVSSRILNPQTLRWRKTQCPSWELHSTGKTLKHALKNLLERILVSVMQHEELMYAGDLMRSKYCDAS